MKELLLLLLLCLSFFSKGQEVDVILIGGQSNATGQGYIRNIPQCFQVDTSVLFFYSQFLNKGKGSLAWRGLCQA